jgi:creatinine amidohydrolase/Fe(II)-dependent formamide hydrolase-like protein
MLRRIACGLGFCLAIGDVPAAAQVMRVADLNTAEIRALDRARTVVMLPGGMLEEHGPFLPAYTDGILSERLTEELAQAIVAKRPGWTVLVFPQMPVGASGSNELGGHFVFPGTYVVRPSTLRAIYMDLASELGDQGFRWVLVVHVHGAPLHIRALDQAGDYFHDAYGGRMINLWGLVPVLGGWGNAMASAMTDAQKKEDGVSLHGGMDEHSLMLHLRPDLVAPGYKNAPSVAGGTMAESFDAAKPAGWPGYLGAPRLATAALGRKVWEAFAAAAVDHALRILDGADPAQFQRYADLLSKNPLYQDWIADTTAHDERLEAKEREWIGRRQFRPVDRDVEDFIRQALADRVRAGDIPDVGMLGAGRRIAVRPEMPAAQLTLGPGALPMVAGFEFVLLTAANAETEATRTKKNVPYLTVDRATIAGGEATLTLGVDFAAPGGGAAIKMCCCEGVAKFRRNGDRWVFVAWTGTRCS